MSDVVILAFSMSLLRMLCAHFCFATAIFEHTLTMSFSRFFAVKIETSKASYKALCNERINARSVI